MDTAAGRKAPRSPGGDDGSHPGSRLGWRRRGSVTPIGAHHELRPNQVASRELELIESWPEVLAGGGEREGNRRSEVKARATGPQVDRNPRQRSGAQHGPWPYKVRSDHVDFRSDPDRLAA